MEKESSYNPDNDHGIFNKRYEGQAKNYQDGKYAVHAASLGPDGKPIGGSLVASFHNKEDAQRCVDEINGIDPVHDAKIDTSIHEPNVFGV